MISFSEAYSYYSKDEIAQAIAKTCQNREVGMRRTDSFAKRPDIIQTPQEVIDAVKNGVSSFHISEERWQNPLFLKAQMTKSELDELRSGWDLIIDIDFPILDGSKIICHEVIEILKSEGVKDICVKFSGNKGFHIGVPFEAFPSRIGNKTITELYPKIAQDILAYISTRLNSSNISEKLSKADSIGSLEKFGILYPKLIDSICKNCQTRKPSERKNQFICKNCGAISDSQICRVCKKIAIELKEEKIKCEKCKKTEFISIIKPELDSVMLSVRHLFRAPYSLHEKSGLVSIPIKLEEVLNFDTQLAKPSKVKLNLEFLNPKNGVSTVSLIDSAYKAIKEKKPIVSRPFTIIDGMFPPCILKASKGMSDGKKRTLFFLVNYFHSNGWPKDKIENWLNEWNQKNTPPLPQSAISSQINYRISKNPILPPNCKEYYIQIGICEPDQKCLKIKNPIQYARKTN